jgi:hypothetical protein
MPPLGEESCSAATRDPACSTRRPISFGYLQVQADRFAIDQNKARLEQLLAGGIEVRVSAWQVFRRGSMAASCRRTAFRRVWSPVGPTRLGSVPFGARTSGRSHAALAPSSAFRATR